MHTPRYEYSRSVLQKNIEELSSLSLPYGLTVRYAVKANAYPEIVHMINRGGIHFDASSCYECRQLLALGIAGNRISLSSQQSAHHLEELLDQKIRFVATSFNQLEQFLACENHPQSVAVRINPPMGSGHNNRTNTGGVTSSFGIWHEYIPQILKRTASAAVVIDRIQLHIGSGADPSIWATVMQQALAVADQFPQVTILNIGGGFKVHRYGEEKEAPMGDIAEMFSDQLKKFNQKTKRKLHLEIEPGTYLVAHAGTLVAHIDDIVDTGPSGFAFLRLNTGMNDFLRTTLYGAQHHITVVNDKKSKKEYVIVGHNCESGDILTSAPGNSEVIEPRLLNEAQIGDEVRIFDTGAYCASMRARGYNGFPDALEVMVD